jgi:peptidoglycan/LPS O-acetylase OafA/YrhL
VAPYAPLFAAGMALYVIHRTGHAVVPWLLVAANTAAATAALVPARMHSLGANSVVEPSAVLLAVALPACVGLVALVSLTPLARWRWAGLTAAGALTYPLYLTHEYWGLWVIHLLHDRLPVWAVLAAATAFSLLLAWLVHRFVEKPFGPRLRRATTAGCERVRDALVGLAGLVRAGFRSGQEPGTPPTTPGSREPSRIAAKKDGVWSGSRSTVEPAPPGR